MSILLFASQSALTEASFMFIPCKNKHQHWPVEAAEQQTCLEFSLPFPHFKQTIRKTRIENQIHLVFYVLIS